MSSVIDKVFSKLQFNNKEVMTFEEAKNMLSNYTYVDGLYIDGYVQKLYDLYAKKNKIQNSKSSVLALNTFRSLGYVHADTVSYMKDDKKKFLTVVDATDLGKEKLTNMGVDLNSIKKNNQAELTI